MNPIVPELGSIARQRELKMLLKIEKSDGGCVYFSDEKYKGYNANRFACEDLERYGLVYETQYTDAPNVDLGQYYWLTEKGKAFLCEYHANKEIHTDE